MRRRMWTVSHSKIDFIFVECVPVLTKIRFFALFSIHKVPIIAFWCDNKRETESKIFQKFIELKKLVTFACVCKRKKDTLNVSIRRRRHRHRFLRPKVIRANWLSHRRPDANGSICLNREEQNSLNYCQLIFASKNVPDPLKLWYLFFFVIFD